jgi:hypothetical protein
MKAQAKTGDIVTFEGTSPLDWAIQFAEGQPFNHVGMILELNDDLYFWDAPGGGDEFPDPFMNNQPHAGCRVANLDDLIAYYMELEVGMFYRQLTPALTTDQQGALSVFIPAVDGLPFPGQDWQLPDELNLGFGLAASFAVGNILKVTVAGSYFCAHLIADTYMHLGLLPVSPFPPNSYSPADFDDSTGAQLPLQNCTLGTVYQITYP